MSGFSADDAAGADYLCSQVKFVAKLKDYIRYCDYFPSSPRIDDVFLEMSFGIFFETIFCHEQSKYVVTEILPENLTFDEKCIFAHRNWYSQNPHA